MKRNFDIEKVAAAIEADAGHALPDIRQALAEVKQGAGSGARQPRQNNCCCDRHAPRWGFRKQNLPRVLRHPPEPCVTGSKAGLRRLVRLCACCAC